jgi:GNAT superfamily N-acetyltransferase
LIVAAAAEGRGVARALLAATEAWAAARGYRFVTLNVFAANTHARRVYERAGYVEDAIRYIKELR